MKDDGLKDPSTDNDSDAANGNLSSPAPRPSGASAPRPCGASAPLRSNQLMKTAFSAVMVSGVILSGCGGSASTASSPAEAASPEAASPEAASPEAGPGMASESIAVEEIPTGPPFNSHDGIAVKGVDVVAYFTESKPVFGDEQFNHEWGGAKWLFKSAEHRDQFSANPDRYAPRYGGYCAFGTAKGFKVDIDPNSWRIVDDQLFLNVNPKAHRLWEEDVPGFVSQANENWPTVKGLPEPKRK